MVSFLKILRNVIGCAKIMVQTCNRNILNILTNQWKIIIDSKNNLTNFLQNRNNHNKCHKVNSTEDSHKPVKGS